MLDITVFFADDPRVEVYRAGECDPRGTCILYWMQRAQRGRENAVLNAAIALGNTLNLPIVVLFVLTDYPAANLRHYHFMLEGLASTAEHLQERGTPLVIRRGAPAEQVLLLAKELQAAAILSDESELRTPRAWRNEVKQHTTIPFACIDADVVVPGKFFPKEEWAARTIRQNGRISASMVIWTPIAATYYSASTSAPISSASASSSTMTAWPGSRISISRWPSMACT
jgi:deoxyribodipyrimidine photo-lyase